MPVPDYQALMLPVLRVFAQGEAIVKDILPTLQRDLGLSDEEAAVRLASGSTIGCS